MTHAASPAAGHDAHAHDEHVHEPSHYVKIWALLIVLLIVSILGPMIGIQIVTLMTAFGIAIVKAYIVCAYFMHLNIEKRFAAYLLATALAFLMLFYFAVAPDVMKHSGTNWTNVAAQEQTKKIEAEYAAKAAAGGGHGPASTH